MVRAVFALRLPFVLWAAAVMALSLMLTAAFAQKFNITPVAEEKVSRLPPGPLSRRVDTCPTLAKAQATESPTSLAAEVDGKAWLFTLGPSDGSLPGGSKVAEVAGVTHEVALVDESIPQ